MTIRDYQQAAAAADAQKSGSDQLVSADRQAVADAQAKLAADTTQNQLDGQAAAKAHLDFAAAVHRLGGFVVDTANNTILTVNDAATGVVSLPLVTIDAPVPDAAPATPADPTTTPSS